MDRLTALLSQFSLRARVFNTGQLCHAQSFSKETGHGHIHVLRQGSLRIQTPGQPIQTIQAPYLLFYIQPTTHRLLPINGQAAIPVCGEIAFGNGLENPVTQALPERIAVDLNQYTQLNRVVELLFTEAGAEYCGRQAALDRICELLVIELLRVCMNEKLTDIGLLAGLADQRLAKALNDIHENPSGPWTLNQMAKLAGMSRASFASKFRNTVGMTPGEYISSWRLGLAKELLEKGRPISLVSDEVGYSSAAAFSRAFSGKFGITPSLWLKKLI